MLLKGFTVPAFFRVVHQERVTIAFLLLPWLQDILVALDAGRISDVADALCSLRLIHTGPSPSLPAWWSSSGSTSHRLRWASAMA